MPPEEKMNIHYLQHVPFEGLGSMESAFKTGGYQLSSTQLCTNQLLPAIDEIAWLKKQDIEYQ